MTIFALLNQVHAKGIKIWHENGQLKLKTPKGALTDDIREQLIANKDDIIAFLNQASAASRIPSIRPVDRTGLDRLPLSFAQERLWFMDRLKPGSSAYSIPGAVIINGELDIARMERAFNLIIARHDSLRTVFPSQDGEVRQRILDSMDFRLEIIDLSGGGSADDLHAKAKEICQAEAEAPFDLASGPLIRGKVIRLAPQEHVLMINMHHIISDGWSRGVLVREFGLIVDALGKGLNPELPPLPIQYVDYSIWQREWLAQEGILKQQLAYWQRKLADVPDSLDLVTDFPRPSAQSFAGASHHFSVDADLAGRLNNLAEQQGCTLYMVLLAAFKVLLYRYTRQEDICVGSPIAGRQYGETESLIGMFVNTLALRSVIEPSDTFAAVLTKVKATCLEAYENQDAPFEKIIDLIQPQRNMAITPLFQVMLILQNTPEETLDPRMRPYPLENRISKFDLTLEFTEAAAGLAGAIEYSTALYKPGTIRRMADHFTALCRAITAAPAAQVLGLDFVGAEEQGRLLSDFNATAADYDLEKSICRLFAEQAASNPEQTAVEYEGDRLSYGELYERSRDLALYLQSLGVGPDRLVGLCAERSLDMLVGLLGILQAGGAYVPLDPDYPKDRLGHMLEDSKASIVLTQERLRERLGTLTDKSVRLVALDTEWAQISAAAAELKAARTVLREEHKPGNLAYVIFTSGSTGKPKGVMVEHRGLTNFLFAMQDELALRPEDKLLAVTTLSFDIAALELMLPLTTGASLVITAQGKSGDGAYLRSLLSDKGITIMQATPATWQLLLTSGWTQATPLKILCGGEALTEKLGAELLTQSDQVWNVYGPTETTIWSTIHRLTAGGNPSLIGHPIANTQIYILNEKLGLQPTGIAGELHIGGAGLARGYLNRSELTAEKFIRDPFSKDPGARLYKTGDLARWLPEGRLDFIGRIDNQVKLRGFRIELGEIENQLSKVEGVAKSVVLCREDKKGDKRLVAYIVPSVALEGGDEAAVAEQKRARVAQYSARLKETLPAYMVPGIFVFLEKFPLTPNGKINRKALPAPEESDLQKRAYVAPRNEREEKLCAIWQEVLGVERVGVHDNFFELGGHSLLLIQLISRMEKAGIELLVDEVMQFPTIDDVCRLVDDKKTETAYKYKYTEGDRIYSIPNRQHLFKNAFKHHWNMSGILNISDPKADILESVLREVITEHQGLRHSFYQEDGVVKERINSPGDSPLLQTIDLSTLKTDAERSAKIEAVSARFQTTLNLGGPLYRFVLFDCGQNVPARFLWIVHHSVMDAYSINIFYQEVFVRYLARIAGKEAGLPEQTNSIVEWGHYLHGFVNSEQGKKDFDYWMSLPWEQTGLLLDYPEGVALNKSDDKSLYGKDIVVTRELDARYSAALGSRENMPRNIGEADIIFTAFTNVIASLTGRQHVRMDLHTSGRDKIIRGVSVDRTIGWFATHMPVMIRVNPELPAAGQLSSYRGQVESIPSAGLSFNALKYLSDDTSRREAMAGIPHGEFNINFIPGTMNAIDASPFAGLPVHLVAVATENPGPINSDGSREAILWPAYIQISKPNDTYNFLFVGRDNVYKAETVERTVDLWLTEIRKIIDSFGNGGAAAGV